MLPFIKFSPLIRLFTILVFLFIQLSTVAQTLEEIKAAAGKDQWEKARSGIDRWLSDAANARNPEGWYLKSLILYKIVSNKESRALAPGGQRESFEAYKKYMDLLAVQKKEIPADHEILFGLYFNEVDRANHEFQFKNYAEALQGFLDVEQMEQYMLKKGLRFQDFSFPAFDTQLYVNIAAAAASAGREDLALDYYRKIADQKIAGKGFDGIYRYLVDRFDKKGERSTRDRYLAIGKELYPQDHYWCQLALKDAGTDKKKLFAKYEELVNGECNNYLTHYNYAVELYNYSFLQSPRPADFQKMQARIPVVLKKALTLQPSAEANLLICRYELALINDLIDNYNSIHETTAEKLKKKEGINQQVGQRYEEVLHHANNALSLLEANPALATTDKENYKTTLKMLSDYWERKNDKVREKEYRDKLKGLD